LANNIRYGQPDATDEAVIDAARRARAHDFILEKPGGYQAVAGDPGCALTGGQQQRIAIARAFLRNAPVLLIDEAYSALDPESEANIQAALEELSRGKTVIAIPYRPATILAADRVYWLDSGRIQDAGTHEELMRRSEAYRQLYDLQFHAPDLASPPILVTV
jgi:ABC-type multidrug transport system fused ATPase/permease subunit